MTLDFSNFKFIYLAFGFAAWLVVMVVLLRRPNTSNSELYHGWQRQNPGVYITMEELIAMPDGPGSSTKWEAIGAFTFAFLAVLFMYLVYGCRCVRW